MQCRPAFPLPPVKTIRFPVKGAMLTKYLCLHQSQVEQMDADVDMVRMMCLDDDSEDAEGLAKRSAGRLPQSDLFCATVQM